jgi:hypothetical protein
MLFNLKKNSKKKVTSKIEFLDFNINIKNALARYTKTKVKQSFNEFEWYYLFKMELQL